MSYFQLHQIIRSITWMLLFSACQNQTENLQTKDLNLEMDSVFYAKGFQVFHNQQLTKLEVKNPWQFADNIHYEFWLDQSVSKKKIKVPLKRVVCLSTSHLAYIHQLGEDTTVVGITNSGMVSNTNIQHQLITGVTKDIGNEQALNYEKILSLKPDVVFAYGVGAEVQGIYQKFLEWDIPVVVVSEYLEESPLAKAEWIKFFAQFYMKQKLADSIFQSTEHKYQSLCKIAENVNNRPMVMSSLPWKDVWYVPGGNSFMGKYIHDAGGNYIWAADSSRESLPLSIEKVFYETQNAEIWINTGMAQSRDEIAMIDPRMPKLKPYILNRVYNNTLQLSPGMGNDFWESGCVNPHLILSDLIKIFHPSLLEDVPFYYYKQLN